LKLPSRHNLSFPRLYLLIAAFVLLVLSYLSSLYFRTQPSVFVEQKSLSKYIHQQQRDFNELVKDSLLMRKLVQQNETLAEFKKVAQKLYPVHQRSCSGTIKKYYLHQQISL
jgi:hypothetical protein